MTEDYPYKVEQLEKNFQNILVLNKDIDNIKEVMDKKLKFLEQNHHTMKNLETIQS